jgi:hypothetical protein
MNFTFLEQPLARRAALIAAALLGLAGVVTGREKPALEPIDVAPARKETAPPAPEIDLARLERRAALAQGDPFAPKSFAPAPAPRSARAAPAERPSAPPLPFTYLGRVAQGGVTEVFVLRGDELISIAAGRNIDAEYRVDAISDTQIAFTYLPLKEKQSLELGEAGG